MDYWPISEMEPKPCWISSLGVYCGYMRVQEQKGNNKDLESQQQAVLDMAA